MNALGATEGDWMWFFHPELALGERGGTFEVVSLGYDPAPPDTPGGSLTLGLGVTDDPYLRGCAVDGPGDDLIVYENAFVTTDPVDGLTGTNNEVATLEVAESAGGPWYAYPHSIDAGQDEILRSRYTGFAGVTPAAEGGDGFDLAAVIAAEGLPADFRACYVRLRDGGTRYADYGNTQTDLWNSGADINAVEVRNSAAAAGLAP